MGVNLFMIRTIKLPESLVGLNKQRYVNLSPSDAPFESHETAFFVAWICVYKKRHLNTNVSS